MLNWMLMHALSLRKQLLYSMYASDCVHILCRLQRDGAMMVVVQKLKDVVECCLVHKDQCLAATCI